MRVLPLLFLPVLTLSMPAPAVAQSEKQSDKQSEKQSKKQPKRQSDNLPFKNDATGIYWVLPFEKALEQARQERRLLLIKPIAFGTDKAGGW